MKLQTFFWQQILCSTSLDMEANWLWLAIKMLLEPFSLKQSSFAFCKDSRKNISYIYSSKKPEGYNWSTSKKIYFLTTLRKNKIKQYYSFSQFRKQLRIILTRVHTQFQLKQWFCRIWWMSIRCSSNFILVSFSVDGCCFPTQY